MSDSLTPKHRRQSFNKDPSTYHSLLRADVTRKELHTHILDLVYDGFWFYEDFRVAWEMPGELEAKLPYWITRYTKDYMDAGAAMSTTLDRMTTLREQAIQRGWPEKKSAHLSRSGSHGAATVSTLTPPQSSSMNSPEGSFSQHTEINPNRVSDLRADLRKLSTGEGAVTNNAIATPPWTPEDAKPRRVLTTIPEDAHTVDPLVLDNLLQIVDSDQGGAPTPPRHRRRKIANHPFDLNAWEQFLKEFGEELNGAKNVDMVRLRHCHRQVSMVIGEKLHEEPGALDRGLHAEFKAWWKVSTERMRHFDRVVDSLEVPSYEACVNDRRAQGLSV